MSRVRSDSSLSLDCLPHFAAPAPSPVDDAESSDGMSLPSVEQGECACCAHAVAAAAAAAAHSASPPSPSRKPAQARRAWFRPALDFMSRVLRPRLHRHRRRRAARGDGKVAVDGLHGGVASDGSDEDPNCCARSSDSPARLAPQAAARAPKCERRCASPVADPAPCLKVVPTKSILRQGGCGSPASARARKPCRALRFADQHGGQLVKIHLFRPSAVGVDA